MRREIRWHLIAWSALAAVPGLLIVDAVTGLAYRTGTDAEVRIVTPRSGSTNRAIVVLPGYIMSGAILGAAFAPYIDDSDAMVVVSYAERGVDPSQIFGKVMAAIGTVKPHALIVYGASMGGMVGALFLDRYRQAGAPYGPLTLIFDSSPAGRASVKRSSFLFDASCWYRGGLLSSAVWALASGLSSKPPVDPTAQPQLVSAAHHFGAWVGMPAITSQACFIGKFTPPDNLRQAGLVRKVEYLQGSNPSDDPLIRILAAISLWRGAFPDLEVVTVPGREGRWHLPLIESPQGTAQTIDSR